MATPIVSSGSKAEMARGIARWAGQMIAALVIFGAILFLAAGRLNWIQGWVYLGMNTLTQALSAIVRSPAAQICWPSGQRCAKEPKAGTGSSPRPS